MRTRRPVLTAIAAAVLLLGATACSGKDDPGSSASPVTSGDASSSADESPTPEPVADDGPVDPCDLVKRSDWVSLVASDKRKSVAELHELDNEYPSLARCRIGNPFSGGASATLGYSLGPGVWDTIKRRTRPNALGTDRVSLPGIGDEAFYATGLFGVQGFARSGDYVVAVTAYDTVTVGDLTRLLGLLLGQAEPAWLTHPVDLPPDCPGADDPALTRLLGPVQYARGGVFDADGRHVYCDYAAANGTSISTQATQYRPHAFQTAYGYNLDPLIGQVVDPSPGLVRSVSSDRTEGSFSATSDLPATRTEMTTSTYPDYRMKKPRFRGDRESFIAWLDRVEQVVARGFDS